MSSNLKFAHVRLKYRTGGYEYLGAVEIDMDTYNEHGMVYLWAVHSGEDGTTPEEIVKAFQQGLQDPETLSMLKFQSARENEEVWINPFEVASWRVMFSDNSINRVAEINVNMESTE